MRANKYAAPCATCKVRVPRGGGSLTKSGGRWIVNHLDCDKAKAPRVVAARFYGGRGPGTYADVFQNVGGRCIDAPCCGCCS